MSAPLVIRSTGDIISVDDHNDVMDYIEDGSYRTNTLSLEIQGTEIVSSTRAVTPSKLIAVDSNGIKFYASDGITHVGTLDDNGNLIIKGRVLKLP